MRRRDLILAGGSMVMAAMMPARAVAATRVRGGRAFGSTWRAVVPDTVDQTPIVTAIEQVIAQVDASMSPYKSTSALSRFNRAMTAGWHAMPDAVCDVAREALAVAQETGGAFDPAVGPTVARFGFGPIAGARGRWQGLEASGDAIRKDEGALTLDLCGIAKGHALDRIVGRLHRLGIGDAVIELGGEIAALGHHPSGRDWQIAIENPNADRFAAQRIVAPRGLALATSGHRANGLRGPVATSHIIDPGRQRPVENGLASVSVLAASAMRADALATSLCAMPANATDFAETNGIAALFVRADGTETATGGFDAHLVA
jgi:thiamine biosynthesis lipoprotein